MTDLVCATSSWVTGATLILAGGGPSAARTGCPIVNSKITAAAVKRCLPVISISWIFGYLEKICFHSTEHLDYHGPIFLVYIFFDSAGKSLYQTRHFLTEFSSFNGQVHQLRAPIFRIITPDYQILFFEPVKYPGHIGGTFSDHTADLTLGPALLAVQVVEQMKLFSGEIEWLEQSINIIANGLRGEVNSAA